MTYSQSDFNLILIIMLNMRRIGLNKFQSLIMV